MVSNTRILQLPPQNSIHVPRRRHVPLAPPPAGIVTTTAAATKAATHDGYAADKGKDEFGEVKQPRPGRPRQYNRNARPPPRPVDATLG
jgi:hypothetical protein